MIRKISARQREELIQLWINSEFEELRKRQAELGVNSKYAHRHAHARGLKRKPWGHKDPRWAWAIERGAIQQ